MMYRTADLVKFIGYSDRVCGDLDIDELLVIGKVEPDGAMYGYRAFWGRVYEWNPHLVWPEEVALVPTVPIPVKRLPPPVGDGDNEEEYPGFVWTGCRIGHA